MPVKPLRLVALACSIVLGVFVAIARGMVSSSGWAGIALGYASLIAGILLLVSLALALLYRKLHVEGSNAKKLLYEALVVFVSVFSLTSLVALVPTVAADLSSPAAEGTSGGSSSSAESSSVPEELSAAAAERLRAIDLDALTALVDAPERSLIYISRDDCPSCQSLLPELVGKLEELQQSLPTYSTTQDREGARADEMAALLGRLGVSVVPSFVLVEGGQVLQMWDEPTGKLDEILAAVDASADAESQPGQEAAAEGEASAVLEQSEPSQEQS